MFDAWVPSWSPHAKEYWHAWQARAALVASTAIHPLNQTCSVFDDMLRSLEHIECVYRLNVVKDSGDPSSTLQNLQRVIARAKTELRQKPVAWRVIMPNGSERGIYSKWEDVQVAIAGLEGNTIVPLYAAPPAAPVLSDVIEEIATLVENLDIEECKTQYVKGNAAFELDGAARKIRAMLTKVQP